MRKRYRTNGNQAPNVKMRFARSLPVYGIYSLLAWQFFTLFLPDRVLAQSEENRQRFLPATSSSPNDFTESSLPIFRESDPRARELLFSDRQEDFSPLPETPTDAWENILPVFQLQDVQPTDWAYEALRSLVERYNCLQTSDDIFRGQQTLSRNEFAVGLNDCLANLQNLLAVDRETVQKLRENFQPELTELATTSSQVDSLEARITELQANQFSTTVKFGGQTVLNLATSGGGNPPGLGNTETVFAHQTQLAFLTSFTGRDRFTFAFSTGNFDNLGFANFQVLNTYMALLNSQSGLSNDLVLNSLEYRTAAFNNRVVFTVKPLGFSLTDVLTANTPYLESGHGAVSRFASGSPFLQIGALNSGFGFDWLVSDRTRLQMAYGVRNSSGRGLFDANHRTLGIQVLNKPSENIITGVAYLNGYASDGRLDTLTGSFNADTSGFFLEPADIHALNFTMQIRLHPNVVLGAWGGFALTRSRESQAIALSATGSLSLGIADPFGREGDFFALMLGIPPKLIAGAAIERIDADTSLHFETFYRFRINDNLSILPGFFLVTDPGHIRDNSTIFVGSVRTVFRF
ncbi:MULTISPECIES: iron uptake porin [Spirulina sp. CCY15215]|uniref:iron uptake porin n=1 Tax=Spirulina sp. CCY15215 TaxID=2767591 RepID=UPI0019509A85|nr:iron uptake porin [Spirulina major]